MKTMRMTRRRVLGTGSAAVAATMFGKPALAAVEFDLKLGVNTPETHPLTMRLTEAAKAVGAQSSGRVNITVFSNSQLGGDPEMLSQVRAGGIELLAAPSMTLSTLVPLSGLPSIGFAFQSYDQVWAAMDGGVGDLVREAITKTGVVPLKKVWDNGFRQITSSSSRQLNSVDDLKGFKIRVPVTALLTSLFSGLGALPSSISYSELYSALQTHIVEGQENPLAQVSTGKLYEVQKFCALSNHCWSGYWILGNRRAMAGLPPDLLELINAAFDAAAVKERADLVEMDRSLQAELTEKGMTFNKPDPVQFRAALVKAGFYTQWQKTYGADAWAALEKYTGKLT
ncbi:tripartite ATP-independent transporter DctP family solute receptor [Bradyrhizobium japonicum]|jgi:TRAP-type transport system periplasmic protein|uniref:Tripartite ATP-independent transporter DctP family solute receptor n=3 Tax=Nitrobacteraceae TaxID=41294 RepID=A0ABV4F1S1_BRAEL|nr:tripartite ATP-independent transporter DctP family solute receptor [Bradyrhizobium elkanii]MCP1731457.1 tripartite ATP-independent transporter DctP family solute receptor [Bradyrhizobium elkanii]MCP1758405.1 tripartite ATP-independent transporter DctP family solute receptor [Bradyrhizobium elkanii]MCP1931978.1 tripartite ATP-independent transporter DctP family solute receptor [Bradyrhizobium elkanii]MCP1983721.1 tripartite ATP-independent transporter DctP family solute receptor [Bradyrhizobi